jgi:hypothetical protein
MSGGYSIVGIDGFHQCGRNWQNEGTVLKAKDSGFLQPFFSVVPIVNMGQMHGVSSTALDDNFFFKDLTKDNRQYSMVPSEKTEVLGGNG